LCARVRLNHEVSSMGWYSVRDSVAICLVQRSSRIITTENNNHKSASLLRFKPRDCCGCVFKLCNPAHFTVARHVFNTAPAKLGMLFRLPHIFTLMPAPDTFRVGVFFNPYLLVRGLIMARRRRCLVGFHAGLGDDQNKAQFITPFFQECPALVTARLNAHSGFQ